MIVVLIICMSIPVVSIPNIYPPKEREPVEFWTFDAKPPLEFYEKLAYSLAERYPKLVTVYSIGRSWRERDIWVIEITSLRLSKDKKTGIAIIGNIHGNEWQSGLAAAYTAWWFATNYEYNNTARKILDNYVLYIVPILNPDGYVEGIRENLRPMDRDGDGVFYSDPYFDTNGDGFISMVYIEDPSTGKKTLIGYESKDFDKDGKPGDDPKRGIDLNRNFNYMWARYDADTGEGAPITELRAGPFPASEPEVQAIQRFLITHPVWALATLHTGEQSVLWPWCYSPEPTPEHDFMSEVAKRMAEVMTEVTGRNYYYKQSYHDYPTAAELIDWSYGRLHIHSYTVEVYAAGTGTYNWGNPIPPDKWEYIGEWQGFSNVWFRTTGRDQIANQLPPDLSRMMQGWLEAAIVMIMSEPSGTGPQIPEYLGFYDVGCCSGVSGH
ncbi:MAG: M14 family zinc carboxypeptidase [Zestosphaera sp.]